MELERDWNYVQENRYKICTKDLYLCPSCDTACFHHVYSHLAILCLYNVYSNLVILCVFTMFILILLMCLHVYSHLVILCAFTMFIPILLHCVFKMFIPNLAHYVWRSPNLALLAVCFFFALVASFSLLAEDVDDVDLWCWTYLVTVETPSTNLVLYKTLALLNIPSFKETTMNWK